MMVAAILASAVMQWNITLENTVHFMAIYRAAGASGDNDEIMGRSYPMSSLGTTFKGLSIEQLRTPGTALRFQIIRQEGTLTCTGHSAANVASGDFTYVLDQNFGATIERRGAGRPTERMQLEWLMADADVYGLIDAASEFGFSTPKVGAINTAVIHGVTADFLKGLRGAGIHPSSFDEAIAAVDHGGPRRGLGPGRVSQRVSPRMRRARGRRSPSRTRCRSRWR